MKKTYHKLVRDRITDIIAAQDMKSTGGEIDGLQLWHTTTLVLE